MHVPTDLIGCGKAARIVNVSPSTIKRWIDKGRLSAWRVGGRYRVSAAELRGLLTQVPPPPTSPAASLTRRQQDAATRARLARHGL